MADPGFYSEVLSRAVVGGREIRASLLLFPSCHNIGNSLSFKATACHSCASPDLPNRPVKPTQMSAAASPASSCLDPANLVRCRLSDSEREAAKGVCGKIIKIEEGKQKDSDVAR
jgi:hypothetical protein